MPQVNNLFAGIPEDMPEELFRNFSRPRISAWSASSPTARRARRGSGMMTHP